MIDWTSSMQQTFEYYIVDPGTWKDKKLLTNVKSCTISFDATAETLGSATIDIAESIPECYVRVYLIAIQNGIRYKYPLGTFLVQTPASGSNGKNKEVSMDAYTPLMELKENPPPLGYFVAKKSNIMEAAHQITREHARAPVVPTKCDTNIYNDFIANTDDTWLRFVTDLIANAKYEIDLDEMGNILFAPKQDLAALQPIWTFNDDNSSILHPDITVKHDLYGVPNVVEVIYSNGAQNFYARVVNDDVDSPISTVNRGREIIHRDTEPNITGYPSEEEINSYAKRLLKNLSSVEYTLSYTHGYCPVRIGDCVRLNYERADIRNVKAKVISQSIKCTPGCPVTETAIFTKSLWG